MFCNQCGAKNSDTAVYCQKCGKPLVAEEETRVARKVFDAVGTTDDADESEIFSITPTLMFVKIGYALAALGALLLVALMSVFIKSIGVGVAILLGLALLLIPAYFHLRQKLIRYKLTDAKVEIDEGFIFQRTRNVPLRSIQDVSVNSTITQRLLGFGNLEIDNASEDGGKIILRNINTPKKYADILLKQMRRLNK